MYRLLLVRLIVAMIHPMEFIIKTLNMKKLILGLLLFSTLSLWGQKTDTQVKQYIDDNVRNNNTSGGITKAQLANVLQAIADAKASTSNPYVATGTNTYAVSVPPIVTSYVTGAHYPITFTNGNSASSTVNWNSLGAKTIKKIDGSTNLLSGDIPAGATFWVLYDGTNMRLMTSTGAGGGGSGTVTSVSVTTANGVSGSVATATSTPAITLTLGAIVPTTVNGVTLSGSSSPTLAVTGTTTVTGANTGDQTSVSGNAGTATALATGHTIGITGDVTYTSPSFDGTGNVTASSTVTKVNGTSFAGLATGILKNTTTTGVPSIAIAADFPTLNQSTSGNAATSTALATARAIYGNNFDGTAALAQIIASTFGGTGNGFAKFSGPSASEKTFTLPNASSVVLTDNAAVTGAQGGTGVSNSGKTITVANSMSFPADGSGVLSNNGSGTLTWVSSLTNPMTTRGDIIIENASPAPARLAVGSTGKVLHSDGTDPSWQSLVVGDLPAFSNFSTGSTPVGADYVVMNQSGSNVKVALSSFAGYSTVQAGGSDLTQRTKINVKNGLTSVDDSGNSVTTIQDGGALTAAVSKTGAFAYSFSNTGTGALTVNGTWTASASLQKAIAISPTLTGTGTTSDILYGMDFTGASLIAGANSQDLSLLNLSATYNVNSKTSIVGKGIVFNPTETGSLTGKYAIGIKAGWNVGIGSFAPTTALFVTNSTAGAAVATTVENSSASGYAAVIAQTGASNQVQMYSTGNSFSVSNMNLANQAVFYNTSANVGGIYFRNLSSGPFVVGAGGDVIGTNDALRINTKGSIGYIQQVLTSSWLPAATWTPGAHTGMAASTAYPHYVFNGSSITEASGTIAVQPFAWFKSSTWNGTSGTATATIAATLEVDQPTLGSNAAITNNYTVYSIGKIGFDQTITAGGTTGNQTINKASGTVNIAAAGTSVTVTNSLCTVSSTIIPVIRTNDATAVIKNVVPGAGSFVITLNAATTAEISIGFLVIN